MEETILLRKATIADLPVLLQCEQGIIAAERPYCPTLKEDPVHYYDLQKMLTDPQTDVIVAEWNGEIIACGYSRIDASKHFYKHPQHAYLGMMYVRAEHRGKGINAQVMEALTSLAKRRGITEARLDVFIHNESAVKAYEKVGFQPYLLEMRMSLD